MENSVSFIICSLFYSILLLVVFFNKFKERKGAELKFFSGMCIMVFICLILEICNFITVSNIETVPTLNLLVSKLYLASLMTWDSLFVIYIYVISNCLSDKTIVQLKSDKMSKVFVAAYIIIILSVVLLPINFSTKVGQIYSFGPAVNAAFVITEIMALFAFFQMFKNIKRVGSKKYAPFFMFIVGGIIVMMIQSTYPQMLLLTSLDMFITFMTFFSLNNRLKDNIKVK